MNNYFEGDVEVFLKLIDGYARNEVLKMSLPYKKATTCNNDNCKNRTKLQAAHIIGFERKKIISRIIETFVYDKKIKIDIDYFKEKFQKSHEPFKDVVKILCRDCHVQYEKEGKLKNVDYTDKIIFADEAKFQKVTLQSDKKISKEISFYKNAKSRVLKDLKQKYNVNIEIKNCAFSNLIKPQNVWWLEPNKTKFQQDFYFVLHEEENQKSYVFFIRKNALPKINLKERNENQYKFEISFSNGKFIDKFSNISFKKFQIN